MIPAAALGFILYGKDARGVDLTNPAVQRALNFTNPLPRAISPSGMGHYGRGHDVRVPVDYATAVTRRWPGAFGAAAPSAGGCGAHSHTNPVTQKCDCDPGYEWENYDDPSNYNCKPAVCKLANESQSPVTKNCACNPGFHYSPDGNACLPGPSRPFPDCKDASGKKLSGCVMGYSVSQYAPWAIGGAFAGIVLAAIAMSVVR